MPSIKLSVTVRANLEAKYDAAALAKIDTAVSKWIAADALRGIATTHVALDDAAAMNALGVPPVTGKVTALRAKRAVDALWKKLVPDYLVLFGASDVVPYFEVKNPSYSGPNGDDDKLVPTDNPYACSKPFSSKKRASYLIPDRVVGRIPDMVEDGDPAWFVEYLATATAAKSEPRSAYGGAYGICCDEWKNSGSACMTSIGQPAADLLVSPPVGDATPAAQGKLASRIHMVKCHGSQLDPQFYGQQGNLYPVALTSKTLKPAMKANTLAAAMCCYGAQIYNPADPAATVAGEWPLASTYLRKGALGFAGSTMIAWVGPQVPMCADWIVIGYLKGVLQGSSQGRALLESKQDYVQWLSQQGQSPDLPDEKTLIEFVLLGDPSIHPVLPTATAPVVAGMGGAAAAPVAAAFASERRFRRVFREGLATQIRGALPTRTELLEKSTKGMEALFGTVKALMAKELEPAEFKMELVSSQRVESKLPGSKPGGPVAAGMKPVSAAARESHEYYWSGRRMHHGVKDIRLVKVQTDAAGNVVRSLALRSG